MRPRLAPPVPCLLAAGCTPFATVRSARVERGLSAAVHASASTDPGDEAGWFWAYDCAERCDHPVVGFDAGVTYGWPAAGGRRPTPIYQAERLAPGHRVAGPAVVESYGTSVPLHPGQELSVDAWGNLVIEFA